MTNENLPAEERLNPIEAAHFEDISVAIIGIGNTVLIEDRFPLAHRETGKAHVWLTMAEARGLRDWLNKALPNE